MSFTIRLQRLPLSAAAGDIRKFFTGLNIPDGGVHIVGGPDGIAFITFATDDEGRQALRLDGDRIHDSEVRLFRSSKDEMGYLIAQAKAGLGKKPPPSAPAPQHQPSVGAAISQQLPYQAAGPKIGFANRQPMSTGGGPPANQVELAGQRPQIQQQQPPPSAYSRPWGDSDPSPSPQLPHWPPAAQQPSRYLPEQSSQPAFSRIQTPANQQQPYPGGRQPMVQQMMMEDKKDGRYEDEPMYVATPGYREPQGYQQSAGYDQQQREMNGHPPPGHGPARAGGPPPPYHPAGPVLSREAQEALAKLPPHLRPPHGQPPPHLRHLFANLGQGPAPLPTPAQMSPAMEPPPRDRPPSRGQPYPQQQRELPPPPYRETRPPSRDRYGPPPGGQDRFEHGGGGPPPPPQQDRFMEERGPPTQQTNSWRARDEVWDSRPPIVDRPPYDDFPPPDRRDLPPLGYLPGRGGPPVVMRDGPPPPMMTRIGPPPPLQWFFIELSRLPEHLVRPAAIEEFLKPTVPFSVSAVKTVFNKQGVHMETFIRVDNEPDFKRFLTADGYQGIRVRATGRSQFEEAIDGPPPGAVVAAARGGLRRSPADQQQRRGSSPDGRRRAPLPPRANSKSPPLRRRRSRSRSPRRDRRRSPRPRSPRRVAGAGGGRQAPNRWCLQLTNVPFKVEPEEVVAWLGERVKPSKVQRTFYADGNASDRWVAEFENESSMDRARNHRTLLHGRTIRMQYIDNDYADEIMAIEDKYGENKKKEFDMKQMAELQLQHLNGTLGPLGVPRFFNNPASSVPQVPQQHYLLTNGRPGGAAPPEHVGLLGSAPLPAAAAVNGAAFGAGARGGGRGGFRGGRGRGGGGGFGAFNGPPGRRLSDGKEERESREDIAMFRSLGPSGSIISCHGFPPDITLQDIVHFFGDFPVDESSIRIKLGSGDAVVCIRDPEKARRAVGCLDGAELGGNRVLLHLPDY